MDATSLKITNCNDTYCRIELCFDSADISLLRLLQADKLRYEINVINNSKRKTKLFSTERNRNETNEFNVLLAGIPGDSGDVFDIKVMVYRFKHGKEEPLLFQQRKLTTVKLLQNRIQIPCTMGTSEVAKKSETGIKLPEKGILSLQMISDESFTLNFRHNWDIYIDLIVNQIEKVQYKITITNTTQNKTVCFSATRSRSQEYSFIISFGHIPGEATDEFDVEIRACKIDDLKELLTWGRLDSHCKLLLQRKPPDPSQLSPFATIRRKCSEEEEKRNEQERTRKEGVSERVRRLEEQEKQKTLQENIRRELDKQEAQRRKTTDAPERHRNSSEELQKSLEAERRKKEAERMRKQEVERITKLEEAKRTRKLEEAARIRKKEEAERIKKQEIERIKKLEEAQRHQDELKIQEEANRIRKQQMDRMRVQQAQHRLQKLLESTEACSNLAVETTDPRKVTLCLKFDSSTFIRIRQEMFLCSGQFQKLKFEVKASNKRTQAIGTHIFAEEFNSHEVRLPLPLQLKLGYEYEFTVTVEMFSALYHRNVTILTKEIKHKEVLVKSELKKLMQKAEDFQLCGTNNQQLPVMYAYRNKPRHYFDNIKINRSNIMEVYIKDNNGDPGCPINGQINGLFFGVRPEPRTMDIPDISLFGDTRIFFPVKKLIQPATKFYFADFYCHKKIHYITFVATKPNSPADKFCEKHLMELSLDNNPFFYRRSFFNGFDENAFYCCREPRVEILYTENIDLNQDYIQWQTNVPTIGRGSSTPGGIPKRQFCMICNLYLLSLFTTNANSF